MFYISLLMSLTYNFLVTFSSTLTADRHIYSSDEDESDKEDKLMKAKSQTLESDEVGVNLVIKFPVWY